MFKKIEDLEKTIKDRDMTIFEKDKERLFLESKSKPISKISTVSRKYFLFFRMLIESSDINYKVFVIFGREKISVWYLRGGLNLQRQSLTQSGADQMS